MLGSEDMEVNGTDKMFPLMELYSGGRLRGAGNTMQTLTKKSMDCEECSWRK